MKEDGTDKKMTQIEARIMEKILEKRNRALISNMKSHKNLPLNSMNSQSCLFEKRNSNDFTGNRDQQQKKTEL